MNIKIEHHTVGKNGGPNEKTPGEWPGSAIRHLAYQSHEPHRGGQPTSGTPHYQLPAATQPLLGVLAHSKHAWNKMERFQRKMERLFVASPSAPSVQPHSTSSTSNLHQSDFENRQAFQVVELQRLSRSVKPRQAFSRTSSSRFGIKPLAAIRFVMASWSKTFIKEILTPFLKKLRCRITINKECESWIKLDKEIIQERAFKDLNKEIHRLLTNLVVRSNSHSCLSIGGS